MISLIFYYYNGAYKYAILRRHCKAKIFRYLNEKGILFFKFREKISFFIISVNFYLNDSLKVSQSLWSIFKYTESSYYFSKNYFKYNY